MRNRRFDLSYCMARAALADLARRAAHLEPVLPAALLLANLAQVAKLAERAVLATHGVDEGARLAPAGLVAQGAHAWQRHGTRRRLRRWSRHRCMKWRRRRCCRQRRGHRSSWRRRGECCRRQPGRRASRGNQPVLFLHEPQQRSRRYARPGRGICAGADRGRDGGGGHGAHHRGSVEVLLLVHLRHASARRRRIAIPVVCGPRKQSMPSECQCVPVEGLSELCGAANQGI
mmetsp:Transcript_53245/g.152618  ORF Transcript_53245/g.152618 Transcript_53245/m.152618 type:complete len:231 (+) Transcript_53245:124-816(+)